MEKNTEEEVAKEINAKVEELESSVAALREERKDSEFLHNCTFIGVSVLSLVIVYNSLFGTSAKIEDLNEQIRKLQAETVAVVSKIDGISKVDGKDSKIDGKDLNPAEAAKRQAEFAKNTAMFRQRNLMNQRYSQQRLANSPIYTQQKLAKELAKEYAQDKMLAYLKGDINGKLKPVQDRMQEAIEYGFYSGYSEGRNYERKQQQERLNPAAGQAPVPPPHQPRTTFPRPVPPPVTSKLSIQQNLEPENSNPNMER